MSKGFPMLYSEPCHLLCDKITLQLTKWIETYTICLGNLRKKDTNIQRGYIQVIKKAFKTRTKISKYGQITLFTEKRSALCQRDTAFLKHWVDKYHHLTSKGKTTATNAQERGDTIEDTGTSGADFGHRTWSIGLDTLSQ